MHGPADVSSIADLRFLEACIDPWNRGRTSGIPGPPGRKIWPAGDRPIAFFSAPGLQIADRAISTGVAWVMLSLTGQRCRALVPSVVFP
jgi:hypothetical protein